MEQLSRRVPRNSLPLRIGSVGFDVKCYFAFSRNSGAFRSSASIVRVKSPSTSLLQNCLLTLKKHFAELSSVFRSAVLSNESLCNAWQLFIYYFTSTFLHLLCIHFEFYRLEKQSKTVGISTIAATSSIHSRYFIPLSLLPELKSREYMDKFSCR